MEINDQDQQDDHTIRVSLSREQSQPVIPQCVSSRRQPSVEVDYSHQLSSSEESNEHPFAPQAPRPLSTKYRKPYSPRRKEKSLTNQEQQDNLTHSVSLSWDHSQPVTQQCVSTRRQPVVEFHYTHQSSSSENSNEHPFTQVSKPLPPKYLKPISPRRKGKPLTTPHKKDSIEKDKDCWQNGANANTRKSQDSISTGDSGKSSLSDESGDYQGKDDNLSSLKKQGKTKVSPKAKGQVHHDEESLFRHHLMKKFQSREDASSSVLSYLSSNIDFVLPDIVSLRSRKTDQDPFNSTYSEAKLESLEHIFISDEVRFKRIFIQGKPGSGKSTFLKKITNDWASTKGKTQDQKKELTPYELFLDSVTFLFLVPLDKVVDENDIATVLNKYVIGKDCPMNIEDIVNVIQQQGSNCLFLLDGYDEYSDASIAIDQLIAGETFPNATIVLTSQHWKRLTPMISDTFNTIIEIKGFNDEQARRFTLNFMKSKKHGIDDREFIESELWNCLASEEYEWMRTNPQSLLFGCICFLETATISTSRSGLYKDFIHCLYEVFKREKTNVDRKSKKISLATSQKPDPTLQALLVNTGKVAFRCLLGRKQSPKRIPSHWFDQEMYSNFLLTVLELGVIQETKIISRQKDLLLATFVIKIIEEFLAAYYLCNVNDASIVFHEQAAIIELIKAGKIEKSFVYKFLDILVFAAGINPLITCELLTILIPEMESDYIVMGKLSKCAEEMELVEGVGLSLMCLSFDKTISQKLVQLCKHSLEYLTLVNCEVEYPKNRDNVLTEGKEHLCVTFFTNVGNLSNLKFLKLDHVNVDKMNQDRLLLPNLQELVLRTVSPKDGTVKMLNKIQSPVLQEVTIDFCDFEDESVSFPNIETLHTLTLGNIKLSRLGCTSLLQSLENTFKLNSLACLNLTILGNDVVFPRLNSLKRLELSGVEFESETSTTKMFTSFNKLRNLEVLEVRAMPVDKLVGHLDVLTHLKRVSFSSIVFSSEIAFSKSNLSNLELHSLSFVAHNGQSFISSMVYLPSLVTLTICYCNFGKENINFLKLKTVKNFNLVNNQMTSNCWCVSVFSLGQLVNIETLEVTYRVDEESFVGEVLEDIVDQRSPVPKIVSSSRSGKDKSVTVDFTNKEPLMKAGSCCIQ